MGSHKALIERYEQRLKDLDPELITPEDEIALKEAFMHAKEAFEPEELVSWFTVKAEPFYRSGSWKVLFPLYEELLDIVGLRKHIYNFINRRHRNFLIFITS